MSAESIAEGIEEAQENAVTESRTSECEDLFTCARNGDLKTLRQLARAGHSLVTVKDGPDGHPETPLHVASAAGQIRTVQFLLEHREVCDFSGYTAGYPTTPLHAAAKAGHRTTVQLLLKTKLFDVNAATVDGSTAFSLACRYGHSAVAVALFDGGADIEQPTNRGATPFLIACQEGQFWLADWLANRCNVNINTAAEGGFDPFYMGCQNGHLHIVRLLVRLGLHRIDARGEMLNTFGTTPFYIAAQNGHLPILQYLLTVETIKARWFEHAEKNGATPFYIACEQGHLAVAEFLAKQGANFEAANSNYSTPLFIACLKGHLPIVRLLVDDLGADYERPNSNGATPFYVSCEKGHIDIVQFLALRANVARTNNNGVSPLWIACQDGHLDVVKFLSMRAPELVDCPKSSGATPFCIACHQGHAALVAFLLNQFGTIDIERPNQNGATPLFYAAFNGHAAVVRLILSSGGNPNVLDSNGCSPFYAACQQGHLQVVQMLANAHPAIETWIKSEDGTTPLDAARTKGHTGIEDFLNQIHSVPHTTPLRLRALQRLAWACALLDKRTLLTASRALRSGEVIKRHCSGRTNRVCSLGYRRGQMGVWNLSLDLLEHVVAHLSPRVPWETVWPLLSDERNHRLPCSGSGSGIPGSQIIIDAQCGARNEEVFMMDAEHSHICIQSPGRNPCSDSRCAVVTTATI